MQDNGGSPVDYTSTWIMTLVRSRKCLESEVTADPFTWNVLGRICRGRYYVLDMRGECIGVNYTVIVTRGREKASRGSYELPSFFPSEPFFVIVSYDFGRNPIFF